MSIPTTSPSPADDAFDGGPLEDAAFQTMQTDAVLAGRAMSSGEYLAGVLMAGELDTVGCPEKLARDLWPDQDPVLIQAVWERAVVVGYRAAQVAGDDRGQGERLHVLQGRLSDAGFHAMAGSVARSRRLVAPEGTSHPADGEAGHGH
ncbi:hypothetical protein [Streptomyces ardesiacus]|uniref:hypothetical protein n=1 Tax=Streptomyces ardesiacus TaxID=285564 RepID=UPI003F4A06DF